MKNLCLSAMMLVLFIPAFAQNVTITPSGITPVQNGSYPRLSYDAILAIASPQIGDMAFDLTYNCLRMFMDGKWLCSYQDPSNYLPNLLAIVSAGGTGGDFGNDIVVDAGGNVYITGYFSGTATFGTTTKTSAGANDFFVAKYNPAGLLQWVQTAGGTGEDLSFGLALDGSGNVYVTGYFFGTATFGAYSKTSAGVADLFVAKYDPNGTVQWVQSAGGTNGDFGNDIAVDGSGNVYVIGYFFGTATFGTTEKTSAGSYDFFVVKYNTSGTLQWVQTAGGSGNDYGYGIEVDGTGNVYVTGSFQGTVTFGSTPKTSVGNSDIFLAKYNSSGVVEWVQSAGGTTNDEGRRLAIDGSDNVYMTGSFRDTATFGRNAKTSAGSYDLFIGRLDK